MIRPTKLLNPDRSVLYLSTLILKNLIRFRIMKIDDIGRIIDHKLGESSRELMLPSLSFLFLLGVVDYNDSNDCVIFQKGNSEVK